MIDVGGTGQQSVIAAVVCCVAMEAKQIIIRGVVRGQHTYVKCDCEEANRQRQAPSRDQVLWLCEGKERSRGFATTAAVCNVRRMRNRRMTTRELGAFVRAASRLPLGRSAIAGHLMF